MANLVCLRFTSKSTIENTQLMKKIFTLILGLVSTFCSYAQQSPFDIDLWPAGLPNTNGIDRNQPFDDSKQNFKPSIRVFLPDAAKATGTAVVCPAEATAILPQLMRDTTGQSISTSAA